MDKLDKLYAVIDSLDSSKPNFDTRLKAVLRYLADNVVNSEGHLTEIRQSWRDRAHEEMRAEHGMQPASLSDPAHRLRSLTRDLKFEY